MLGKQRLDTEKRTKIKKKEVFYIGMRDRVHLKLAWMLCFMLMMMLAGGEKGGSCFAATYQEIIKQAEGSGKPADIGSKEEEPVLVSYQVGDTSSFLTGADKTFSSSEESEWEEDWDQSNE